MSREGKEGEKGPYQMRGDRLEKEISVFARVKGDGNSVLKGKWGR